MSKKSTPLSDGPEDGPQIALRLNIGALCDPIAKQLRQQKLKFNPETIKHIQKDLEAFCRLKVRYDLPVAMTRKFPEKLWKKVAAHVAEMN